LRFQRCFFAGDIFKMSTSRTIGKRLALAAFIGGFIGLLLWLGSYIWIPFRFAGRETDAVWSVVIASEIGAMAAGLFSLIAGAVACRITERNSPDFYRAKYGFGLGVVIWIFLVAFNLIGIYFFS